MAKSGAQLDREIAEVLAAREISDRRIAALIANGEDVRNTVAWRDAQHERRAINFADPVRAKAYAKRARDARAGFTKIAITWYARPNENKRDPRGAWMPIYELDGKIKADTYGRGYGKSEAEAEAEALARKEAERYVGDWDVTVKKGRPKK